MIRAAGWFPSGEQGLKAIANVAVKSRDGTVITVSQLAEVKLGQAIRQGAVTMTKRLHSGEVKDLGEVVSGIVLKRMGANTKATIDSLQQRITLINQALPPGVSMEPFYDQSSLVNQAVMTVVKALALAFVFIVVVLALFLMNLSATFLVLISIPIAIAIALMLMAWLGISANLMSLGGIAVAIGMLVDGSVVMVENICKRLAAKRMQPSTVIAVIRLAAKEVAKPIFFASGIILLVFTPLFSFVGVEAKLFQPMAVSIMLALVAAVIVALVVVPALACIVFRHGNSLKPSAVVRSIERGYRIALPWVLQKRKLLYLAVLSVILAAGWVFTKLGTEFVPELEEGTLNLRVTLAPSASLDTALELAPKLENALLSFPEVTYALSRIGRAEVGGDPEPVNNIEIYLGLQPPSQWQSATSREALQQLMQNKLAQFPGLLLNFSQPIATRVDELLSGVKAQLAIKLFGPDLKVLANKGREIASLVSQVQGTEAVQLEQIVGEAQLVITPNRQALSRFGLAVNDVMAIVQQGIGGATAGQIINGNERYDIVVRLAKHHRNSKAAIKAIRLQSKTGAWIRLADVAEVEYQSGPPQIRRDDVQRRVVVQANVSNRDMGSVVKDIRQLIDSEANLPPGYSIKIGGQYENQQRAQQRLRLVIPVSVALIAVLLYFAFASFKQALLILVNVPLAMVGGVFSLYWSGQYLSVPGSVGFITLFGVAVLNGVVLVASINQQLQQSGSVNDAIIAGASSRLRPVLMTALTSALGLLPMLMATGVGAEIQKPLASVIIGGLLTSTLLTLFVLPALYHLCPKYKSAN